MCMHDGIMVGSATGATVWVQGVHRLEDDLSYFTRRLSEERTAAAGARHPDARHAHLEMAKRYEDRVRVIASRKQASLQLVG